MRLGKVRLDVTFEYVVDLEDKDMVAHAKECVFEDLGACHRELSGIYGDPEVLIVEEEVSGLSEADIPNFLRDNFAEEDFLTDIDP